MRRNYSILPLIAASFLAAPVMAGSAAGQISVQQSATGVRYVSGGIGQAEAAAIESRFGNYSFKLTNVRGSQGAYLTNVDVTVSNAAGQPVLISRLAGPRLFADLPAGSYNLTANFDGQTQTRPFNIAQNGHESVILQWNTTGSAGVPVSGSAYSASMPPEDRAAPGSQAPVTIVPAARVESSVGVTTRGDIPPPARINPRAPARAYGTPANTVIPPQDRAAPASAAPVTIVPPAPVDSTHGAVGTNRTASPTYSTSTPAYGAPVNTAIPWEDRAAPESQAPVTIIPSEQVEAIQSRNKKPAEPKNYNRPYPGSPASGY